MTFKKSFFISENKLQAILTLLGMLLACQIMFIQHGWINDDSVLYFEIARLFSIGEWKQGNSLFSWPFYPALISFTHQLTQLSFQTSAQLLNVIFFGITVYSFTQLIRLAGGHKSTILCGVFLLFGSNYIVGDVLPMLLRDQGFWAMFLTSLIFFVQYSRHQQLKAALLWQFFAILAVLFRVEAITYLAFVPLLLMLEKNTTIKQRLKNYVYANLIPITLFLVITGTLVFSTSLHLSDLGRLQEAVTIFPQMLSNMRSTFQTKADMLGQQVLGHFFDHYGSLGLAVSLISIVVVKVISATGWPVLGIFALEKLKSNNQKLRAKKSLMAVDVKRVLNWVILLGLVNASFIIMSVFILSSRYIVAVSLALLILAAFKLDQLIKYYKLSGLFYKITIIFLVSLTALFTIKSMLPKGAGYNFEQDAIAHLKKQQIPINTVFFVSPRSRYFAGAPYAERGYVYWDFIQNAITSGKIYQYNYLLLNVDIDAQYSKKQQYLNQQLSQYQLVKEFYGYKKKKKIMLYKQLI
jgi:hypothetical protein